MGILKFPEENNGTNVEVVDNLGSTSKTKALSANQGKQLDNKITILSTDMEHVNSNLDVIRGEFELIKTELSDTKYGIDDEQYPTLAHRLNHMDKKTTMLESEKINVKNLGAKGDGENDDTMYIQKAIDMYDTIFLPEGIYNVTSLKINKSNLYIYGEKGKSVLNGTTDKDILSWDQNNYDIKNISIKKIKFTGNKTYKNQSHIRLYGVDTITIEDCIFYNAGMCGITNFGGTYFKNGIIRNCEFNGTVESGLTIRPFNGITVENCIFHNIEGGKYPPHGVYLRSDSHIGISDSKNAIIKNNVFKDVVDNNMSNKHAIKISYEGEGVHDSYNNFNITISDNIIENYQCGITVSNTDNLVISNNIIKNGEKNNMYNLISGIVMTKVKNGLVSGNNITCYNRNYGVISSRNTNIHICNNSIQGRKSNIFLTEDNEFITIESNKLELTTFEGDTDTGEQNISIHDNFKNINILSNTCIVMGKQRGIQSKNDSIGADIYIQNNLIRSSGGTYGVNLTGNISNSIVANNLILGFSYNEFTKATNVNNVTNL